MDSLAQEVGAALGAQAGEARLKQVATQAGFTRFRRAAETPFNLVFEARDEQPEGAVEAPSVYHRYLPVKNSLIVWPLNLAPSTTVWPMPLAVSFTPVPTLP